MKPAVFARCLAPLLLASTLVHASPEDDAKDLFVRGRELRKANNCAAAVPAFKKAQQLMPSGLGSLRNIAECEELLGHPASARRAWLDLGRALLTNKDEKYSSWAPEAAAAAARLAPSVARIRVNVVVAEADGEHPATASTPDIELTENGAPLALALIGTELERDPGTYIFRAAPKGGSPIEKRASVTTGDKQVLTLRVVRPAPPATPSSPEPLPVTSDSRSWQRPVGWIGVGVGAASIVTSLVTLGLRQGALSDLESACPRYETAPCDDAARDPVSRGQTMSTLTTVFGIGGLLLAGGGAALLLTAPSARTGIRVGPGNVAFRAHFD